VSSIGLAACLLCSLFSQSSLGATIKTSDGNGADTELREDDMLTRGGAKDLNSRWEATPMNLEIIVLRFDLSGVDRTKIGNAQLQLTANRTGMPADNGFQAWGLNPEVLGQDWIEGTSNGDWNAINAFPGVSYDGDLTTFPINPGETTFLGSTGWTNPPSQGEVVGLSSLDLTSFLQTAGDLATLYLSRSVAVGTQIRFASKETAALGETGTSLPAGTGEFAPQLTFDLLADASWINSAGGQFYTGSNWDSLSPPLGAVATFDLPDTYVVTFDADATTSGLLVRGGKVTFDLGAHEHEVDTDNTAIGEMAGDVATLTVRNGTLDYGSVSIGKHSDSTGTLKLENAGTLLSTGFLLLVGDDGTGTLSITDAAALDTFFADVGSGNGSVGAATIDGIGARWDAFSDTDIGDQGDGTLSVVDGGVFEAGGTTRLGRTATGIGRVHVTGADSSFVQNGSAVVGEGGYGELMVSGAATVGVSSQLQIGNAADAIGEVTVEGSGSRITVHDYTTVGNSGNGTLTIENQGQLVVDAENSAFSWMLVGQQLGAIGTVHVDGIGSRLEVEGSIVLGGNDGQSGGSAMLKIENGGEVSIGARLRLWDGGTLQLIDGELQASDLILSANSAVEFLGGRLQVQHVEGSLTNQAGTLASGASVATMEIDGNYNQHSDGSLEIEIAGTTPDVDFDRLMVEGIADLAGTIDVSLLDFSPNVGEQFTIIEADSIVDSGVSLSAIAAQKFDLIIDSTTVSVVFRQLVGGDYNGDGIIDAADYTVWRDTLGQQGPGLDADGNGDEIVDVEDYNLWKSRFGASVSGEASVIPEGLATSVPEPAAIGPALLAMSPMVVVSARRRVRAGAI
jgi:T5SS/PEP-CTERM-associated repeat protein